MQTIYIVEDDRNIREIEMLALKNSGYRVQGFETGKEFYTALAEKLPTLVMLDIMLPDEDGISILQNLRRRSDTRKLPVILVTAKGEEIDKVRGFDSGADDYIAKPFRPRELVSRIRSVLRRTGRVQSVLDVGPLRVDTERACVSKNGQELSLSALEYRLLLVFLNHRGATLSRAQLLEEIWDVAGDFVNDNTLTVYIKRLRDKLEDDPQDPALIRTVRGVGYRMEG